MTMTIDFYYKAESPPCRAVHLTAKALNLDLNLKVLDVFKGEHLKPDFIKINPQHTVPTLVDDGFALSESRAIMAYLANKYGKDSGLYPEEPRARAVVDQRLYFDIGTLYQHFGDYLYPRLTTGAPADKDKLAKLEDALKVFDTYLEDHKYAAGDTLTIADLSLIATVSTFEVCDVEFLKYSNVKRWYETVKSTAPGYQEVNQKGLEGAKAIVESRMK